MSGGGRGSKEEVSITLGCLLHQRQSSCLLASQAVGMPTAGMVPSMREGVVVPACASSGAPSVPHHHIPSSSRASEQLSPKGAAGGEHTWVSHAQAGESELVGIRLGSKALEERQRKAAAMCLELPSSGQTDGHPPSCPFPFLSCPSFGREGPCPAVPPLLPPAHGESTAPPRLLNPR